MQNNISRTPRERSGRWASMKRLFREYRRYAHGPAYKYTSAVVYKYTRHHSSGDKPLQKSRVPRWTYSRAKWPCVCMIRKKIRELFCFLDSVRGPSRMRYDVDIFFPLKPVCRYFWCSRISIALFPLLLPFPDSSFLYIGATEIFDSEIVEWILLTAHVLTLNDQDVNVTFARELSVIQKSCPRLIYICDLKIAWYYPVSRCSRVEWRGLTRVENRARDAGSAKKLEKITSRI